MGGRVGVALVAACLDDGALMCGFGGFFGFGVGSRFCRQNGNAADGGWELSPEDMATIAALDVGHKASGSVSNQDDPWADVK